MALAGIKVAVLVIVITGIVFCDSVHCHGEVVSRGSKSGFWDFLELISFGFFRVDRYSDGRTTYTVGANIPVIGRAHVGVTVDKGGIKPYADIDIDIGLARAYVNVHADEHGLGGGIGGKVAGLEGSIFVKPDGTVVFKTGAGANIYRIASVNAYVTGDTKGKFSVDLNGNVNIGIADASAYMNIDDELEITGGVSGGVHLDLDVMQKMLLNGSEDD